MIARPGPVPTLDSAIDEPQKRTAINADGEEVPVVEIPVFPISLLKPGKLVLIVGARGSGKSVLTEDILRDMCNQFDFAIGMSVTPSSVEMFERIMPPSCVYNHFNEAAIDRMIATLRQLREEGKARRVLVIMDDLMFIKGVMNKQQIKDIHNNGRHLQIFFINIAQYIMVIPKDMRSQIDFFFIFRQKGDTYIKPIYDNLFSHIPYDTFVELLTNITADYGCLVFDRWAGASNADPMAGIYFYRTSVDDRKPKYMVGNRDFWKLHHMFYKPIPPRDTNAPVIACLDKSGLPRGPLRTDRDTEALDAAKSGLKLSSGGGKESKKRTGRGSSTKEAPRPIFVMGRPSKPTSAARAPLMLPGAATRAAQ